MTFLRYVGPFIYVAARFAAITAICVAWAAFGLTRVYADKMTLTQFEALGIAIPTTVCVTFLSLAVLGVTAIAQHLHTNLEKAWEKAEKDAEYFRKRAHELSDVLQGIVSKKEVKDTDVH